MNSILVKEVTRVFSLLLFQRSLADTKLQTTWKINVSLSTVLFIYSHKTSCIILRCN